VSRASYALISTKISCPKRRRNSDNFFTHSSSIESEDGWQRDMPDDTAAIMTIHNMAIAIPQILAALSCAGVSKLNGIMGLGNRAAWVFRVAECAAWMATWMTGNLDIENTMWNKSALTV
jgi:hypothetical protein